MTNNLEKSTGNIELTSEDLERLMEAASDTIAEYEDANIDTRSDLLEHSLRVLEIFNSFAGDRIPETAAFIVMLHDVIDRSINKVSSKHTEERSSKATELTENFYEKANLPAKAENYSRVLSHSMVRVEIASGQHRKQVAEEAATLQNIPIEVQEEIMSDGYKGELPEKLWTIIQPYLDFEHMAGFVDRIDIDAIVIKGCELVDNMKNPSSDRQSAWLQDVLEAESFYAPLLELLKFDGLASLLRSEAHKVRLRMSGKDDVIDRAEDILTPIENLGPERIIQGIFGVDSCDAEPAVLSMPGKKPPVFIGDAFVNINNDNDIHEVYYRLKASGSLANKIDSAGKEPMDTFGMTVISKNVNDLANNFSCFIANQIDENSNLTLKSAPSKEKAIFIQGNAEYIESIKLALLERNVDIDRCEFKVHKPEVAGARGYEDLNVAKMTFMASIDDIKVPTEVQFVTADERKRMRSGEIAHVVYKSIAQENRLRKAQGLPPLTDQEIGNRGRSASIMFCGLAERVNSMSAESYRVNSYAEAYFQAGKLVD